MDVLRISERLIGLPFLLGGSGHCPWVVDGPQMRKLYARPPIYGYTRPFPRPDSAVCRPRKPCLGGPHGAQVHPNVAFSCFLGVYYAPSNYPGPWVALGKPTAAVPLSVYVSKSRVGGVTLRVLQPLRGFDTDLFAIWPPQTHPAQTMIQDG